MPTAHIINHTHWDREWFLTEEYTTEWIPFLIDSLGDLSQDNPNYEFLFDGQSLAIEDLLRTRPDYRDDVRSLISAGNLTIGPLYSQPDWRMVSGELHVRNLRFGTEDARRLGGDPTIAWLVDTFGHVSQAPQLLTQFGIEAAYVWRGVPQMTPLFVWKGADGTEVAGVDLFGGYRNLYGVTKTPDIATHRLTAEVDKLDESYGGLPIPLFDGYDLDTDPEDPVRFYESLGIPADIDVVASSPSTYVAAVLPHLGDAPTIHGELISGKFGSTFPGSLSVRTYLKVLHHDTELALHSRLEPLATMAAAAAPYDHERYDRTARTLLQNGVHDCLCGVSIDQVHERMERSYRRELDAAAIHQSELATTVLAGFAAGDYAVGTNALASSGTVRVEGAVARFATDGIGVTSATLSEIEPDGAEVAVGTEFGNEHNAVRLTDAGFVFATDDRPLLAIEVRHDSGDTYSSEPGELIGLLDVASPVRRIDSSAVDQRVAYRAELTTDDIEVVADITLRFDDGPLIDLAIDLDSSGTGFRVDTVFATGVAAPTVHASMPFDIVERAHDDTDLLGHDIDPAMAAILMGQRETGRVTEFPFHDFVAMTDDERTTAIFGQGLRSYQSQADGTVRVTLRRAVEWIALTDLELRSGDAGPRMYVPGARAERRVSHRLGVARLTGGLSSSDLLTVNEAFQRPPLIATIAGSATGATSWPVLSETVPSSALFLDGEHGPSVRLFNPATIDVTLNGEHPHRTAAGAASGTTAALAPKAITTIAIDMPELPSANGNAVTVRSPIVDRGGRGRSLPAQDELDALDAQIAALEPELAAVIADIESTTGDERYLLTHRRYVVERELLELRLSRELNERLATSDHEVSIPDDPDPAIRELGDALNDLRVKRRIYDYVAQALS